MVVAEISDIYDLRLKTVEGYDFTFTDTKDNFLVICVGNTADSTISTLSQAKILLLTEGGQYYTENVKVVCATTNQMNRDIKPYDMKSMWYQNLKKFVPNIPLLEPEPVRGRKTGLFFKWLYDHTDSHRNPIKTTFEDWFIIYPEAYKIERYEGDMNALLKHIAKTASTFNKDDEDEARTAADQRAKEKENIAAALKELGVENVDGMSGLEQRLKLKELKYKERIARIKAEKAEEEKAEKEAAEKGAEEAEEGDAKGEDEL